MTYKFQANRQTNNITPSFFSFQKCNNYLSSFSPFLYLLFGLLRLKNPLHDKFFSPSKLIPDLIFFPELGDQFMSQNPTYSQWITHPCVMHILVFALHLFSSFTYYVMSCFVSIYT